MQQRGTSGNITPPPSANESEPQDTRITTGNEMVRRLTCKECYLLQATEEVFQNNVGGIFIGNN